MKIIRFYFLIILTFCFVLVWNVSYWYYEDSISDKDIFKIQKNSQQIVEFINNYLQKDFDNNISGIKDDSLKSKYIDQIWEIKDKITEIYDNYLENVLSGYYYYYWISKASLIQDNKFELIELMKQYKLLKYEILYVTKTGEDPYSISNAEKEEFDSFILWVQREFLDQITGYVKFDKSYKENWNFEMQLSWDFWDISLYFKEYDVVTNILKKSTNMSWVWWIEFDLNWEYMGMIPSVGLDSWLTDTGSSENQISKNIVWKLELDSEFTMVWEDVYFYIKDYRLEVEWLTSSVSSFFNTYIEWVDNLLKIYKWKRFHIKLENNIVDLYYMGSMEMISTLSKVKDLIYKQSIFNLYKKIWDIYFIEIDEEFIGKVSEIVWESYNKESFEDLNKDVKWNLKYKKKWNEHVLFFDEKDGTESSYVWFSDKGWVYSLEWKISDSQFMDNSSFVIKKKFIDYKLMSYWEKVLNILWKDSLFDMDYNIGQSKFELNWVLDGNKVDLNIKVDWKDVWYVKVNINSKLNNLIEYTYDLSFHYHNDDQDNWLFTKPNFIFNLFGDEKINIWDFDILKPDSKEIVDIDAIINMVWGYRNRILSR